MPTIYIYRKSLQAQNKGFASGFDTAVNQEAENTICTHLSTFSTVERTPTPSLSPPSDDNDGGEDHHDDQKRMDDKSNSW